MEDIKNLCVVAIEWMDEALDTINPRVTNLREILDNKMSNECHRHGMMKTMFSSIDIHEESPLELEKEDDIDERESYFMNTSSNPCSHEKSPESIGTSYMSCIHKYLIHMHIYRYSILERHQVMFQSMGTSLFQQAGTTLL